MSSNSSAHAHASFVSRTLSAITACAAFAAVASALPPVLPEIPRLPTTRQPQNDPHQPRSSSGARVELSTARIDFGDIWDHEIASETVVIRNVGTEPLELSGERGSCGCTVPRINPRVIQPGQAGEIEISFNPAGRAGPQRGKNVTVQTNDPTNPQVRVEVNVSVRQAVAVEPRVVNFGQISINEMSVERVSVYLRDASYEVEFDGVLQPRGVEGSEFFEVNRVELSEGDEPLELPGDMRKLGFVKRVDFEVIVPPNAQVGSHSRNIVFNTTAPTARTVETAARAMVMGDLRSQPQRIMLGQVMPDESLEREFTLQSVAGMPFAIKSVTLDGDLADAEATFEPFDDIKDAWKITVSGRIAGDSPTFRGNIVVETDRGNEPTVRVQYFGYNRAALERQRSAARANPAQTDQGRVQQGARIPEVRGGGAGEGQR